MHRLDGRDAIFLYMDTATRPMHMGFAGVFDPSTVPGGVDDPRDIYIRLVDLLEQRLHLFAPLRQRLVEIPFRVHHPVFVEDPAFDIGLHVRRAALPAPGGKRELEDLVSQFLSRPLDRDRPLWEMLVVEGVEDGRWALAVKAHHAIIDGVGGNEILVNLLDLTPEIREVEPPDEPWTPEALPSDARLFGEAIAANLAQPPRMVRAVGRTASILGRIVRGRISDGEDGAIKLLGPRTVLNDTVSSRRRVVFGRIPLDEVKRVKDALGVKVNDVVLGLCGRALRRYLAEIDREPAGELLAAVPISIREGEGEGAGNRVAGMTAALADDEEDPAEQLRRIHQATITAKERLGAITADLMTDWTEFATPALAAQAFRFYSGLQLSRRHPPVANVTISNVPGPDLPLYLAGSEMHSMYPIGPVIPGQALNITVVSYRGDMFIGAIADAGALSDVTRLVTEIEKALGEFGDAADRAGA